MKFPAPRASAMAGRKAPVTRSVMAFPVRLSQVRTFRPFSRSSGVSSSMGEYQGMPNSCAVGMPEWGEGRVRGEVGVVGVVGVVGGHALVRSVR